MMSCPTEAESLPVRLNPHSPGRFRETLAQTAIQFRSAVLRRVGRPIEQKPTNDAMQKEEALSFQSLPGELRNKVYSFCGPSYAINIADQRCDPHIRRDALMKIDPGLCREWMDFYYINNTFMIDARRTYRQPGRWREWLAKLGDREAGLLTQMLFYLEDFVVRVGFSAKAPRISMEMRAKRGLTRRSDEDAVRVYGKSWTGIRMAADAASVALGSIAAARGAGPFRKSDVEEVTRTVLDVFGRNIW